MVGPDEVPNAVSLNSAIFNSARIVGPAVAGVLINAIGTGWVFVANAASFVAVIVGLALMRDGELFLVARVARARGELRAGLSYLRRHQELLVPIVLVGVVGTFGLNFQITTALMAKSVFHRDAVAFALLSTMLAVGSLAGALVSARRGAPRLRLVFAAALAFGVLEMAAGLMPTYATFGAMLVPTGAAVLTFTTAANSTVQIGSDPLMRGRVMAVYVLVFLGGTPLGAPVVGWLAQVAGPRMSIIAGGAICTVATVALAAWVAHRRRLHVTAALRPRPHMAISPGPRGVRRRPPAGLIRWPPSLRQRPSTRRGPRSTSSCRREPGRTATGSVSNPDLPPRTASPAYGTAGTACRGPRRCRSRVKAPGQPGFTRLRHRRRVWLFWSDRCRGRHDRVEACACEAAPGLGVIGALVP